MSLPPVNSHRRPGRRSRYSSAKYGERDKGLWRNISILNSDKGANGELKALILLSCISGNIVFTM